MYIANSPVTITYVIPKTDSAPIQAADWDISIEKPDNTVEYVETAALAVYTNYSYQAPTDNIPGELIFDYTPVAEGLHFITLGKGGSANFTKYDKFVLNAIVADDTANISITLPTA